MAYQATTSLFDNILKPANFKDIALSDAIDSIQTGQYQAEIEAIRFISGDDAGQVKDQRKSLKLRLPCVTFAGQFGYKNKEGLIKSSGICLLDYDDIEQRAWVLSYATICDDPLTAFAFRSPSGDGIKVGVRIPDVADDAEYKLYFDAVATHFNDLLGFKHDGSGKDISRACFVSFDPALFTRVDSAVWPKIKQFYSTEIAPIVSHSSTPQSIEHQLQIAKETIEASRPGKRHHARCKTAFTIGGYVGAGLISHDNAKAFLLDVVADNTDDFSSASKTIKDGLIAGAKKPLMPRNSVLENMDSECNQEKFQAPLRDDNGKPLYKSISLSDSYNANNFIYEYGHRFKYVEKWGSWLYFDGMIYRPDAKGIHIEMVHKQAIQRDADAKNRVGQLEQESRECDEGDLQGKKILDAKTEAAKAFSKHAKSSLGSSSIHKCEALTKNESILTIDYSELNQQHRLLPVANGVIDLRTGKLLPHSQDYLFTKKMNISYDPQATCPRWDSFLMQIMDAGETEESIERARVLSDFLQVSLGYMTSGYVTDSHFWIFHGTGSNGKSVLFSTVAEILGAFATQVPRSLFLEQGGTQHPTGLATLLDKRFVIASETNMGDRIDTALIKMMTGNDGKMLARRMHQDFWEFQPTHKIILASNHLPVISDPSEGMWRRVYFIPFDVKFVAPDKMELDDQGRLLHPVKDERLKDDLRDEHQGILRWLVEGAVRALKDGITAPAEVTQAVDNYRKEMDVVGTFIEEECKIGVDFLVHRSTLIEAYTTWCQSNNTRPMSSKALTRDLKNRGFEPDRRLHNARAWGGLHMA